MVWTVKSLVDDVEFEPFIESIPEAPRGPSDHMRHACDDLIQRLLRNPDLNLEARIPNLLYSCENGLLFREAAQHREIICYKVVWAIAALQDPTRRQYSNHSTPVDWRGLGKRIDDFNDVAFETNDAAFGIHDAERLNYTTSVAAQMELLQYLTQCDVEGRLPDLRPVTTYLESLKRPGIGQAFPRKVPFPWVDTLKILKDRYRQDQSVVLQNPHHPPVTLIAGLVREITDLRTLKSPPYRWVVTRGMMILRGSPHPSSELAAELERVIHEFVYAHLDGFKDAQSVSRTDHIVLTLCTVWRPDQISEPKAIPVAILQYLNNASQDAIVQLLGRYSYNLWASIPKTLSDGPSVPAKARGTDDVGVEVVLAVLWRLLSLWPGVYSMTYITEPPPFFEICEAVLPVLPTTASPSTTFSVACMIKALVVQELPTNLLFVHRLLPTVKAITAPHEMAPHRRLAHELAVSWRPK
ncbi:hypothetical protein K438DRAFT_2130492 [Mycena galopus ATCC 62051]|nr:hypothetical protein K438DRAFT_2130492 [Mycena galopus ATCC 62051]